jgi:hypothetical protein
VAIITASKTKFSIGTTLAATTLTAFAGDTYAQIGEIESFGAFGDELEIIKFTSLSDGRVQKVQGVADAGDIDLVVGFDPADAGQLAVIAAFTAGGAYNFKVELNNALTTGSGPHNGTQFYFKGIVTGQSYEAGTSKDVIKLKVKIALTTGVIEGPAA